MRLNSNDFQLEGSLSLTLEAENFPTSKISFDPDDNDNKLVKGIKNIKRKYLSCFELKEFFTFFIINQFQVSKKIGII